jgi:hypothetical protein
MEMLLVGALAAGVAYGLGAIISGFTNDTAAAG